MKKTFLAWINHLKNELVITRDFKFRGASICPKGSKLRVVSDFYLEAIFPDGSINRIASDCFRAENEMRPVYADQIFAVAKAKNKMFKNVYNEYSD